MTKSTTNARFQKGSGVYTCRCCGHKTRDTGGDGSDERLCDLCFELQGEVNHLSDTGELYGPDVAGLMGQLNSRNGLGTAQRLFPELWAKLNPEVVAPAPAAPAKAVPTLVSVSSSKAKWFEQNLPMADAIKKIHTLGRKRTVFLMVNQQAPSAANPDQYWPVHGSVKINRAIAEKFVADSYKHFDKRGALVHLHWTDNCIFVG